MSTRKSALAAQAWSALLQVQATVLPRLARELQASGGLPLSWYDVLHELAAAPDGRLTMSELGERVVLSRTRVSRIVDELADAGLARRETNTRDARSAFATLTEAGQTRYRAAVPVYLAGIEREFAAHLTSTELDVLAKALRKVVSEPVPVELTTKGIG
jgi:DNA-binding MarR family transcriptional regulator